MLEICKFWFKLLVFILVVVYCKVNLGFIYTGCVLVGREPMREQKR